MGTTSSIEKSFGTTDISNFHELFNKSATGKDDKNKNVKLMTESDFYKHFPLASARDQFGYKLFTVFDIDGSSRIDFEEFFNGVTIFLDQKSDRKINCLYQLMTDNQNVELGRDKLVDFFKKALEYAKKTFHTIDADFTVENLFEEAKKVVKEDAGAAAKDDVEVTLTANLDAISWWRVTERAFRKFIQNDIKLKNIVDSVFSLSQSQQIVEEVRNGYESNVKFLILNAMPLEEIDICDRLNALEWYWLSVLSRRLLIENPNKAMEMEAKQQSTRRKSVGIAENNGNIDISSILHKYTEHVGDEKLPQGVQLTMEHVLTMEDTLVRQASQYNRLANVEKVIRKTKKDFLLDMNRTKSEEYNTKILESQSDKVYAVVSKRLPKPNAALATKKLDFNLTLEQCHQLLGIPVMSITPNAMIGSPSKTKKKTRSRSNSHTEMDMPAPPPSMTANSHMQSVPYPIESPLTLDTTSGVSTDIVFGEVMNLLYHDYTPCVRGPVVLKPLIDFFNVTVVSAIQTSVQTNISEACAEYTDSHFKQYNADIALLYSKFDEYRKQKEVHEQEYEEARMEIAEMTKTNDTLLKENEELTDSVNKLQKEVDILSKKSNELQCVKEIAMHNLYEEMIFHEKEKYSWDRLKKTHEEDIQALQQSNLTLENEVRQAKLQQQQNCCIIM